MKKRFYILVFFTWICNVGLCQDFNFKWQIWPSLRKAYSVQIEKRDADSYIIIKEFGVDDSIRKNISSNDCDTLISFLDKYNFPIKGNTIYTSTVREYYETNFLPDTNWIQIKGDSIRLEFMYLHGYYLDKDSNKCYTESQLMNTWTDGNTYEGEYINSSIKKTFSFYSARLSLMDFKLNNMICDFIIKYGIEKDYKRLKQVIYADKPRNEN